MRKNDQNKRINSRREQYITIYCHFTSKFSQKHHKNGKTLITAPSTHPVFSITPPTTNASTTPRSPRSFVSVSHQIHIAAAIIPPTWSIFSPKTAKYALSPPKLRPHGLFFSKKPSNTHCINNNYTLPACFSPQKTNL